MAEPRGARPAPSLVDQTADSHGILRHGTDASGRKRAVPSDSTSSESEVQGERAERARKLERRGKRRLERWLLELMERDKQLHGLSGCAPRSRT